MRLYTPIWEAIKSQFLNKSDHKITVEVKNIHSKTVIRMVQKEKWMDNSWGLSGVTKLICSQEDLDSGYVKLNFNLVPHNRHIIFDALLTETNPKPNKLIKVKDFKLDLSKGEIE